MAWVVNWGPKKIIVLSNEASKRFHRKDQDCGS